MGPRCPTVKTRISAAATSAIISRKEEIMRKTPNALHAVSRNGSKSAPVKYLVVQVSDPSKPATVPE